jgi:hypothetical protein
MFLPIPTKDNDLMSSFLVYRWPVLDGWLGMWALKPRLLVFDAINFPALWTCGQDDELVIDNQGFWFRRSREGLPEY